MDDISLPRVFFNEVGMKIEVYMGCTLSMFNSLVNKTLVEQGLIQGTTSVKCMCVCNYNIVLVKS